MVGSIHRGLVDESCFFGGGKGGIYGWVMYEFIDVI